jgi:hypothetical protein
MPWPPVLPTNNTKTRKETQVPNAKLQFIPRQRMISFKVDQKFQIISKQFSRSILLSKISVLVIAIWVKCINISFKNILQNMKARLILQNLVELC